MNTKNRATRIKKGCAQKRNRYTKTPNYWNTRQNEIQIDVENPGKGFKHFLRKKEVMRFLEILPNREEIDIEFDAVVLTYGRYYCDGYYRDGVICICAWEKEKTANFSLSYFNNHKSIFKRLGVKSVIHKDYVRCDFTENQIKAFQLLHVLLHELGHHHDRINTKLRKRCGRGENYAESYAFKYEGIIWNKYFEYFPI